MNILKLGSQGAEVKQLQQKLNVSVDGIFGSITEEAVKEFQKNNNLSVDGIVGSQTWNVLNSVSTNSNKRNITEIIVHCSATPKGEDYTVDQIRQSHLQRGFNDIGYHWIVYRDGSVHKGRDESIVGAHCTGHNTNSIGVCYIGGCPARTDKNWINKSEDTRTDAQKSSLLSLLKELKAKYPKAVIHSHNDFAQKACPSFNATIEYKNI